MKRASRSKGISPLVATIMLIAFTMVVAGILASWASQFAMTQRERIQTCSGAEIFLQKGLYNNATQTLDVIIWNSGDVPLDSFTALVTHTNETVSSYMQNLNATAGSIKTFSITGLSRDIKQVVVRSDECRGAQDMLLKYNINGLT